MRIKMHSIFMFFMACVGMLAVAALPVKAAAGYEYVEFDVQYCQSDIRRILPKINALRTGNDAWYWNEDNTEKVWCKGLEELTYDYALEKVAMQRCADIAFEYGHTRPDGSAWSQAYKDLSYDYKPRGENIAAGQKTSDKVFEAWSEADKDYSGQGHRRNMLSGKYNRVGMACCYSGGKYYWVQEFAYCTEEIRSVPANDSETRVRVLIAEEGTTTSMAMVSSVSMNTGETMMLPVPVIEARRPNTWPEDKTLKVSAPLHYMIADESIAIISEDKVRGLQEGSTTLKVSALTGEVAAKLTVNKSETGPGECAHRWDEGKVMQEPSYNVDGERRYTCTICGMTRTESIPSYGNENYCGELNNTAILELRNVAKGVQLRWRAVEHAQGYRIVVYYLSLNGSDIYGESYTLDTVAGNVLTYTDKNPKNGNVVGYLVYPFYIYEGEVIEGGCDPPEVIQYVTRPKITAIENEKDGTRLTWKKNSAASGYVILRSTTEGYYEQVKKITKGKTTSWKDRDVKNGVSHSYRIYAYSISDWADSDTVYCSAKSTAKTGCFLSRTSITSIKNTSARRLTVKWKKNAKAGGYELQYSKKSDFSSGVKTITVKNAGVVSAKAAKLTRGKTYYVRVRTYKKADGVTSYSSWSDRKSVKIKK